MLKSTGKQQRQLAHRQIAADSRHSPTIWRPATSGSTSYVSAHLLATLPPPTYTLLVLALPDELIGEAISFLTLKEIASVHEVLPLPGRALRFALAEVALESEADLAFVLCNGTSVRKLTSRFWRAAPGRGILYEELRDPARIAQLGDLLRRSRHSLTEFSGPALASESRSHFTQNCGAILAGQCPRLTALHCTKLRLSTVDTRALLEGSPSLRDLRVEHLDAEVLLSRGHAALCSAWASSVSYSPTGGDPDAPAPIGHLPELRTFGEPRLVHESFLLRMSRAAPHLRVLSIILTPRHPSAAGISRLPVFPELEELSVAGAIGPAPLVAPRLRKFSDYGSADTSQLAEQFPLLEEVIVSRWLAEGGAGVPVRPTRVRSLAFVITNRHLSVAIGFAAARSMVTTFPDLRSLHIAGDDLISATPAIMVFLLEALPRLEKLYLSARLSNGAGEATQPECDKCVVHRRLRRVHLCAYPSDVAALLDHLWLPALERVEVFCTRQLVAASTAAPYDLAPFLERCPRLERCEYDVTGGWLACSQNDQRLTKVRRPGWMV